MKYIIINISYIYTRIKEIYIPISYQVLVIILTESYRLCWYLKATFQISQTIINHLRKINIACFELTLHPKFEYRISVSE